MSGPRRPSALRQSDLAKTIKALVAAGLRVVGVKVSAEGGFEVVTDEKGDDHGHLSSQNDWDKALMP